VIHPAGLRPTDPNAAPARRKKLANPVPASLLDQAWGEAVPGAAEKGRSCDGEEPRGPEPRRENRAPLPREEGRAGERREPERVVGRERDRLRDKFHGCAEMWPAKAAFLFPCGIGEFAKDRIAAPQEEKGGAVVWTIFVILLVLWLLGFFAFKVTSGLIHVVLLVAVIVLILGLVRRGS